MGRSSMNSLKLALFHLALLALISMVTSKPKHFLVKTKGSGSSDDYSYPPPPPAYPPPTVYDYKNDKAKDYSYPAPYYKNVPYAKPKDYTYPAPPQVYDYNNNMPLTISQTSRPNLEQNWIPPAGFENIF